MKGQNNLAIVWRVAKTGINTLYLMNYADYRLDCIKRHLDPGEIQYLFSANTLSIRFDLKLKRPAKRGVT